MVVLGMLYVFSTVFHALILRVSAVIADAFPLSAFNAIQHGWNGWNSSTEWADPPQIRLGRGKLTVSSRKTVLCCEERPLLSI